MALGQYCPKNTERLISSRSQKRSVRTRRSRLGECGPALVEALDLDSDREVIHAVARHLTAKGRPHGAPDMIIAAVAVANGCTVVSANEKDFAGIDILNPLRPAAGSA